MQQIQHGTEPKEPPEDLLGVLIEHQREACKLSESKRERADTLSAAQITAATAVGAVLVAAAKSLPKNQVPEIAAWGALLALALTIFAATVTRATFISLLWRTARDVREEHNKAKSALWELRDRAVECRDGVEMTPVQQAILRVWITGTDVNNDALRWKHLGGAVSGACLVAAVAMLGWIATDVLRDIF